MAAGAAAFLDESLDSSRACLKNHSRNLHAPLCGIFHPNSVAAARYDALIRAKSPTNCDAHLVESLFQTRSNLSYKNSLKVNKKALDNFEKSSYNAELSKSKRNYKGVEHFNVSAPFLFPGLKTIFLRGGNQL